MSFIDELAKRGWVVDYYTVSKSFEGVIVTLNKTNNTVTYNHAKISNIEELGGAVIQQLDSVKQLIAGDVEYHSKKLDRASKALDAAKEEFRPKTLGEILIEKGWIRDNNRYYRNYDVVYKECDGYYIGGVRISTYEDLINIIVKHSEEIVGRYKKYIEVELSNIAKLKKDLG